MGIDVEVLMRKHIKWVKNLLQHEPFMPLSQEFLKHKLMKRALYMLNILENFVMKLF
jgi:hypothetical protein